MADKPIQDLNRLESSINDSDTWFAVAKSGAAYKVNGQDFYTAMATIYNAHGSIKSAVYTPPVAPSLDGTLVITFGDDTTADPITLTNGKGLAASSPVVDYWARSTSSSTVPTSWYTTRQTLTSTYKYLWHYQHYTFNDGTSYDTTKTVIGVYGDKGDNSYIWIKYASECSGSPTPLPPTDGDMGDNPDNWIGIYYGTASTAPTSRTSYSWFEIKGEKGDQGNSISAVTKTSGTGDAGTTDTYTVYVGSSAVGTFDVYNGSNGQGSPGTHYPLMDGTKAVGTATSYSREDHVHPTDTSRSSVVDVGNVSNLSGFTATNLVDAANELKSAQNNMVMRSDVKTVNAIGTTVYNLSGLTADHVVADWGMFEDSLCTTAIPENAPWADIEISTSSTNGGRFALTVANYAGTAFYIRPTFVLKQN